MEQPLDAKTTQRVIIVGRLAMLWAFLIAGRLVYLQIIKHEDYRLAAKSQQHHTVGIPADRGEILDRRGDPLAVSIRTETAVINPQLIRNPKVFAELTAPILDLDAAALEARILELQSRAASKGKGRGYLPLKRHITPEERRRLRRLPFGEIEIHRDTKRLYPNGTLAAHIVGSLDAEGCGNSGLEQKLDEELRGRPGRMRVLTDSLQARYTSWVVDPGTQGANLTLSVNRAIQHETETALQTGIVNASAKSGTVVVMNPQNGEILALANFPTFDPRVEKPSPAEMATRQNIAVMAPVEPGSVMKMITVTMGLDTGRFEETTPVFCENGAFPRPGRRALHDVHGYGTLDVAGVLIKSSNIGVAKISIQCGARTLFDYLKRFGMGDRTGIELPGEDVGLLRRFECRGPQDRWCWSPVSHEYIAFGHEIGATAVQLARAVSVIANGGLLVKPHLVIGKQRPRPDGSLEDVPLELPEPRRVLRAETAHTVRRIMQRVVVEGTGRRARLPGYTAGGKTGSAEMYVKGAGWVDRHNSSFIGFAPAINPRIVVVVTISDTPMQGGIAAAPVFKQVATAALRILNVPKDDLENDIKPEQTLPQDMMKTVEPMRPLLTGKAEVLPAAAPESAFAPVGEALIAGPRVPDFRGKNVLAVLRESAAHQMPVQIVGHGIARGQKPEPGTILPAGTKVQVEFARP